MGEQDSTPGPRLCKCKTCEERYIKVSVTHYLRTQDQPPSSGDRPVPFIRMTGHWLKAAGFEIDTPIKVRGMEGCLVLTIE